MFRESLARDPEDLDTRMGLGYALVNVGHIEEADAIVQPVLDAPQVENTYMMNVLGYAYLGAGEADRAVTIFRKYVEQAPEDPNAHDSYAEGLMAAGKLEEAKNEYLKAVEIDHSFANSYLMLGRIHNELGEVQEARQALETYFNLSPTGAQAAEARQLLESLEGQ